MSGRRGHICASCIFICCITEVGVGLLQYQSVNPLLAPHGEYELLNPRFWGNGSFLLNLKKTFWETVIPINNAKFKPDQPVRNVRTRNHLLRKKYINNQVLEAAPRKYGHHGWTSTHPEFVKKFHLEATHVSNHISTHYNPT